MRQGVTVRFEPHDLKAVQVARRALALISEYIDNEQGYHGPDVGIALDDLTHLEERMEQAIKWRRAEVTSLNPGRPW